MRLHAEGRPQEGGVEPDECSVRCVGLHRRVDLGIKVIQRRPRKRITVQASPMI